MNPDTLSEHTTADLAAIFMSLIRAANAGGDVIDDINQVKGILYARKCLSVEEAMSFLSVAWTLHAKAACFGATAANNPANADAVLPLMKEGDMFFRAAMRFLEEISATAAAPLGKNDRRLN